MAYEYSDWTQIRVTVKVTMLDKVVAIMSMIDPNLMIEDMSDFQINNRYGELVLMQRAGEISELRRQVEYELIPSQREPDTVGPRGGRKPGKVIERAVYYIADFVYKDKQGNTVVEDTKGVKTPDYTIKRKLMLWIHKIQIKEVTE